MINVKNINITNEVSEGQQRNVTLSNLISLDYRHILRGG